MNFAAGVYLSEAPSPSVTHTPLTHLYTCILIHTGQGEEEEMNQRVWLEGQQFTKLGQNTIMTVSPVYKL
jgi:hypothetical protein